MNVMDITIFSGMATVQTAPFMGRETTARLARSHATTWGTPPTCATAWTGKLGRASGARVRRNVAVPELGRPHSHRVVSMAYAAGSGGASPSVTGASPSVAGSARISVPGSTVASGSTASALFWPRHLSRVQSCSRFCNGKTPQDPG